eukprot:CAMPEP_0115179240 /NCGR_PEP_ID=MMETSP0270-20121206/6309_1 /TAXON_ID=71861 /ORGANISM="Scrippsiella trochoidea, Strain CCMP3099" /LENGTH=225 /DNA_ID=CAMNT_0002592217 /DNA_START=91 /DNA_END=768 /DNA_ORIENTATION=+
MAALTAGATHPPIDALRQYADRIFVRFPELFVFLGSPSLEEQFDLAAGGKASIIERPNGVSLQLNMAWRSTPQPPSSASLLMQDATRMEVVGVDDRSMSRQPRGEREESMSPFSRSRRLVVPVGNSCISGRAGPRSRGEPLGATGAIRAPAEDSASALPVLLSAASLTRLSPARRRAPIAMDPGKPTLSAPGSYNPWDSPTAAGCGAEVAWDSPTASDCGADRTA